MSIEAMLANAVGGLNVSQAALRTTSENIANVNTPNYVRRETIIGTQTVDGANATVGVEEVRRIVDEFYFRESLKVNSQAAQANRVEQTHDRLQAEFGAPGDNSAFPSRIDAAFAAFSSLTVDSNSSAMRANAVTDLSLMGASFQSLSDALLQQREQADREIVTAIGEVNQLVLAIHDLNAQIERGSLNGESVNGLKDQQDALIADLSKFMDVRTIDKDAGRVDVVTTDGVSLVSVGYAVLSYSGEGAVSNGTVFPEISMQVVHPETGAPLSVQTTLEPHVQSGVIRGLLDLRDKDMPDFSMQIGAAAAGVIDQINAAHNDSIAVPLPNTLEGRNTGLLASDAHGFTGATTVAIVDASGAMQRRIDLDFDAGTYSVNGGGAVAFGGGTIGDVVTALNTALGASGTASLTGGVLTIDAANAGEGVGLLNDATNPSSRAGRGFSHFFGLNDLLQTASPSHFETGFTATDAHGFTAGDTIEFAVQGANGGVTDITFTVPAGATLNDMVTALNSPTTGVGAFFTFSLDADGELTASANANAQDYRLLVRNDNTTRGATGVAFTEMFGIGPGPRAGQAIDMTVRSDIATNPSLLSLGKLDLSSGLVGDIVATSGDNRGALALEEAQNTRLGFDAIGKMTASFETVSGYAAQVLTSFSDEARAAEQDKIASENLLDEITLRREDVQGVNVDEELAQMIVFQRSYNAAARILAAAGELYDTLLNSI